MANLTTLKNYIRTILPQSSRLQVASHWEANEKMMDYLYIPFGIAFPFFGSTIPSNCTLCNGSKFKQADYPYLFEAIGNIYDTNADPDEFNVPYILPGSSLIQSGTNSATGTTFTLGYAGGEETHILDITEIPSHNHELTNYHHSDSINGSGGESGIQSYHNSSIENVSTTNIGGGKEHNNMPPYIVCNWIMRLK